MISSRTLTLAFLGTLGSVSFAAEPLYKNDFESAAVDKAPEGAMVISGDFLVKQEAGNKFLELPGEPLDTFGLLLGPAGQGDLSASARFFGTKKGRKFPTFGVSLGGVGGYRLVVSAGKKMLEIFKGDEVKTSVPFDWPGDAWTTLRLQVRKTAGGCVVEGKAWASDMAEPAAWLIKLEDAGAPPQGRAGVWGSPYSGTPIRFDDVIIAPVP
jgi:hypothetical protein